MRSTDLPQSIAGRIAIKIASDSLPPGTHLSAQKLADEFGVSRSPVREALTLLEQKGLLERQKNRGYFTSPESLDRSTQVGTELSPEEYQDDYRRLAEDWLADRIPADVTEQLLRDRYDVTKARLSAILIRATREGWAERKQGYGWRFLPVAKTPEGFDQIYRFRMVIEPAALLEPEFEFSRRIAEDLRAQQLSILDSDIDKLPAFTLLESGSRFHEALIKMSQNPYFHMALVRVNRMRRLLEYRAKIDRERLLGQCQDHIEILELTAKGELAEASYAMRRHLSGALKKKSPIFWEAD